LGAFDHVIEKIIRWRGADLVGVKVRQMDSCPGFAPVIVSAVQSTLMKGHAVF
jgi:hypothetical protein